MAGVFVEFPAPQDFRSSRASPLLFRPVSSLFAILSEIWYFWVLGYLLIPGNLTKKDFQRVPDDARTFKFPSTLFKIPFLRLFVFSPWFSLVPFLPFSFLFSFLFSKSSLFLHVQPPYRYQHAACRFRGSLKLICNSFYYHPIKERCVQRCVQLWLPWGPSILALKQSHKMQPFRQRKEAEALE